MACFARGRPDHRVPPAPRRAARGHDQRRHLASTAPCSIRHAGLLARTGCPSRPRSRGAARHGDRRLFPRSRHPQDPARADAEILARLAARPLPRPRRRHQPRPWLGRHARALRIGCRASRPAIREACDAGWHVFVVTNQSGVARGLYGEADVRAAARLDGGPSAPRRRHYRRHPLSARPIPRPRSRNTGASATGASRAPGMILDLIRRWELDPARCIMVGDRPTDLAAAPPPASPAPVRRRRRRALPRRRARRDQAVTFSTPHQPAIVSA